MATTGGAANEPGTALPFAWARSLQRGDAPRSAASSREALPTRYRGHRGLLRDGHLDRLLPEAEGQYERRVLHGGSRDDRVDCGSQLRLGQSRIARADGLGGLGLPIWNPGGALVLDRRHSGDALSRPGDDAVLLRLEDAL